MNEAVYNARADRALSRLYGDRVSEADTAELLGAALCVSSHFAPYEEARNPYLSGDRHFIPFKLGWQRAVSNRESLQSMERIAMTGRDA